tara:strand:- start:147 stop:593 length:447 start_codon:yes stop_codon:yes gene_type:complete
LRIRALLLWGFGSPQMLTGRDEKASNLPLVSTKGHCAICFQPKAAAGTNRVGGVRRCVDKLRVFVKEKGNVAISIKLATRRGFTKPPRRAPFRCVRVNGSLPSTIDALGPSTIHSQQQLQVLTQRLVWCRMIKMFRGRRGPLSPGTTM